MDGGWRELKSALMHGQVPTRSRFHVRTWLSGWVGKMVGREGGGDGVLVEQQENGSIGWNVPRCSDTH